jgi:hypothetical protein
MRVIENQTGPGTPGTYGVKRQHDQGGIKSGWARGGRFTIRFASVARAHNRIFRPFGPETQIPTNSETQSTKAIDSKYALHPQTPVFDANNLPTPQCHNRVLLPSHRDEQDRSLLG